MTATETTTETWLYAGERVSAKGKVVHAWYDGSQVLMYGKLTGSMPGHAYAVETERSGEGITVHGRPRYLAEQSDRQATSKQMDEWRAEHAAARATLDGERVEKQAADDDELERALEVVRRHYDRLRTMRKRGAFINYVTGEMVRPPKPDREEN